MGGVRDVGTVSQEIDIDMDRKGSRKLWSLGVMVIREDYLQERTETKVVVWENLTNLLVSCKERTYFDQEIETGTQEEDRRNNHHRTPFFSTSIVTYSTIRSLYR